MIFRRSSDYLDRKRARGATAVGTVRRAGSRALVATATALLVGAPSAAHAGGGAGGGAIGWASAVDQFSAEGVAVGAAAVVLGIIAVGAILMFGITGLITTVVMVCLGGALMGQAEAVGQTLFGAAAGGGSIHDVTVPGSEPG